MDNENKDLQGTENMSPEEKVQADISAKVAEAAEALNEEIEAANGETSEVSEAYEAAEAVAGAEGEVVEEPVVKEPVIIKIKRSTFITSAVTSAVVGAVIMFGAYQLPAVNKVLAGGQAKATLIEEKDGSRVVAKVNDQEITDFDIKYYIYIEAMTYATENNISDDELASYDWNQEVDGKKLSDTILEKAVATAIGEAITLEKGAENGVTIDEQTEAQIDMQIQSLVAQYGEEGMALRARTMGIGSVKQYGKMYKKVMTLQSVQDDMEENASKYYPEDITVLNDYIQEGKGSAKHILIKTDDAAAPAEGEEAAPAEDKQAKAQEILDRINNGEDFDSLMSEYNEDTGESEAGYTFVSGEMQPEFEEAAFALKMGEVSGLVQTTYGYHIIKRVPGKYELQAYWEQDGSVKITKKDGKISKIDVSAVMADIQAANEELEAEQSAATASSSSSSASK